MPAELVRALGAIPSYYLRYYYLTARGRRASSATGHTRAPGGHRHRARAARDVPRPDARPRSRSCSADRGGAFYSEAAAQLIASLHDGAGDVQVVDVRNDGGAPRPARRRRGRGPGHGSTATARTRSPLAPLAPEMRGLVQAVKAYEELAVAAARSAATGGPRSGR